MPDQPLVTFADTADLIGQLDYVVTVDTSVAHLAGLLGVPTFLLLQLDSHWRWGIEDTTPWYPFMRLIRQPTFGDWAGAVRQLGTILDNAST
jgi:ADP-heptose:LPS heptosyltransferase